MKRWIALRGCYWLGLAKQPGAGLRAGSKLGLPVYSPECAGFDAWLQARSMLALQAIHYKMDVMLQMT